MADGPDGHVEPHAGLPFARGGRGLLDGEDPLTRHAADARHWISIYSELVSFKDGLIARVSQDVDQLSPVARTEIIQSDVEALRRQQGRYQVRLDFWYERHWDLARLFLDSGESSVTHRDHKVWMTGREFQLLSYLLSNPNKVASAHDIRRGAWGNANLASEEVRTYIGRVRKKLDELDAPVSIVNHPRRGYSVAFQVDGVVPV